MSPDPSKPSKAARTKARIVEAALELFRENGFEATTMRMVADHAEVSVGNAYYYFRSKEELLQAFYLEIQGLHLAAVEPILERERSLKGRLLGSMLSHLDVIEPYHRFSALLFRTAADPDSPLNPFHETGIELRRAGEEVFERVLAGSRTKVPSDLRAELPGLLWTYRMGTVLYWIHDRSPGRERTRRLIEHTVDLVVQSVKLASNPLMRPLRRRTLAMLAELQTPLGDGAE